MSDPFASHSVAAEQAQAQAQAARARYAQSTPPLAVAAMQQQSRRSTPNGSPNMGEFGTSVPTGSSQSTGARHHRVSMGHGQYTPPQPIASTSATPAVAYGFLPSTTVVRPPHQPTHPAQVMQAQVTPPNANSRKRASHNPAATLAQSSPPKPEQLTDEYVLHPSVYAYKAERPGKPMVGFGPYVLLRTLGTGEFGKVKLGVHTEYGVEVAIKLIRRGSLNDESMANKVEREIDVLKTLKHPNIVRMFDVIDTEKYVGIVIEFAAGGELFEHILANRHLKDRDAQKLFAQLISGVDYLHRKGIIHRDLKLENLLLDKHRNVIITDFGFANRFENDQADLMSTSCGSPCYAAPELVVSEGEYVGSAVDIWSCGIILFAMLAGYLPYDDDPANPDGDNIQALYRYILHTAPNFPDHMSQSARDLLTNILVPDPRYRANMYDIMTHPWLAAHRQLFERTTEMNEWIFQDQMYKKSQQAKRELNERKRVQREAHMAKYRVQRSQSTMPSTAGADGQSTTRRPKSAMPGSSSVPLDAAQTIEQLAAPLPARVSTPVAPELTPNPSDTISTKAVENQSVAPSSTSLPLVQPESSNSSNRHTIQIEYSDKQADESANAPVSDDGHERVPIQMSSAMSDIDASGSELGHDGTLESVEMRLSPVLAPASTSPPALAPSRAVEPTTPKRKSPVHQQGSPSTPRASNAGQMDDIHATPRASMITPKGKAREQPIPPVSRSSMMPPPTIPAPKAQRNRKGMSLDKFGLAKLLGTTQAGSSVDLAKPSPSPASASSTPYTPGAAAAAATRALQTSTAANASAGARQQSLGPSIPATKEQRRMSNRSQSAAGVQDEKKAKRKTLGIMTRTPSVREKPNSVPLSARDMNPATAPVQSTEAKSPETASRRSISSARPSNLNSPSVLTVDAVNSGSKTASSSAAKKVMDWFRRKSIVKDSPSPNHLQIVQTSGRNDSADSFVRVEPDTVRSASAMSQVSSIAVTADGRETPAPPIAEEDEGEEEVQQGLESKEQEAVRVAEAKTSTVSLAPPVQAPIQAAAEANASRQSLSPSPLPEPTRQPIAAVDAQPQAVRVSPPRQTPTRSKSHGMPGTATPSLSSQATPAGEDARLRIHTGVLDQSALSSKPPQDIMNEVIRVLMEMGMEVKRENEYRVRCTRVKKKGRGFGSVISMAGGVMGSASLSRLDSRGLPIPASPSSNSILSPGGIRGMLRRGSTTPGSVMGKSPSELGSILASPGLSSTGTLHSPTVPSAAFEPIYGDHGVDSGDEVKFHVEVCRIKNLPGLYLLNVKRLRGSVWSFKFVYQTIIDRCETLTH